ncbi:MAG: DUF4956 domain-containing protein [Bacteroidaceae bacterium]|nr:DUF4956 domain-containing protein [Bacteroidaceae bacterium]
MDFFQEMELMDTPIMDVFSFAQLLLRFSFNLLMVWLIIHWLYYPRCKRRDYYFTFLMISVSIFFLIFLLGSVKIKVGFALGLFAIFGIIRYRTESMPVREMTYLFVIIAMSVINALAVTISYSELFMTNLLFAICIWICESNRYLKHVSCKHIQYDKIDLIVPEKRAELIADIEKRVGVKVLRIEVGAIDFLRDMAMVKVFYEPNSDEINTIDSMIKIPKEVWTEKE